MDIAVTGAHGLIAGALVPALRADGHRVLRIVRGAPEGADDVQWDPAVGTIDSGRLEGVDAVVHLAGAGIGDRRWTDERKRVILDSRVRGTELVAGALAALDRPPGVLVSASAVGYYGLHGDEPLTEEASAGDDFLADVCRQWEHATRAAAAAGIRVVNIRSGVVLSTRGGVLQRLLLPFRLGLGGRVGSGRQYVSWISIDDEVGAIRHLLTSDVTGPVNVTAPTPVTNGELTAALGRALHRPTVLPTPVAPLKLLYGPELVDHLLVGGQRVLPAALERAGYRFAQPALDGALAALLFGHR